MSKVAHVVLGVASGLGGLIALPYFFLAIHDLRDALSGDLHGNPGWSPYALVGFFAALCFCAFFLAFRFLRYVFTTKSTG
jgi:hypothetical protein